MFLIVCYDVETITREGRRRLRRVAKLCESHGQRAQKSVFECRMERARFLVFEDKLLKTIDPKKDSLRIYFLEDEAKPRIKIYGLNEVVDFDEPLIL
jgi:CRISPR-associated protein Cas2